VKIIVAGDGKVGQTLIRELSDEKYDLILIDTNPDVLASMVEKYDVLAVCGNCASMDVLEKAGVDSADLLIAVTSADEINMLCCMTAHGMNPDLHTIARIRNPEYLEQVYAMSDQFGLSMVFNPEKQAAVEIDRLIKFPGFLQRDTFAKGRVEIVEFRIGRDSKLCDIALNDMYAIIKCKVLVCAVVREGKALAPDGNFVLHEGDKIYVTASTDTLAALLKNLDIITHKARRVIICGGGKISYYLAEELVNSGVEVQIIEKDLEKCKRLAEQLPKACIVNGDASDQSLLESEGLAGCDALVTLTGMDELNMVISLYGNSQKIPQIITKIDRVGNSQILHDLPIGSTICPKELCSGNIVRYVRAIQNQKGAASTIHSIAGGQAEALEFIVDENTLHCNEPLKNLKIKKGVLIACINHGSRIEIPGGDSKFRVGDNLIVVTANGKVLYSINEIFE